MGKGGQNLEAILGITAKHHRRFLKPAHGKMDIPGKPGEPQATLPLHGEEISDDPQYERGASKEVGRFFEYVLAGIFGGHITNHFWIPSSKSTVCQVRPDVIDYERKRIMDSKATADGRTQLKDAQIDLYKGLQHQWQDGKISMIFFKYNLQNVHSYSHKTEELYSVLAKNVQYAVQLPLSMILKLHEMKSVSCTSAYSPKINADSIVDAARKPFAPHTKLKANTLQNIFLNTEMVCEQLGLDDRAYKITRVQSPQRFYVQGNRVTPFPLLLLRDRDHAAWMQRFIQEYPTIEVPDPSEFKDGLFAKNAGQDAESFTFGTNEPHYEISPALLGTHQEYARPCK
jgi:hypothetical protein